MIPKTHFTQNVTCSLFFVFVFLFFGGGGECITYVCGVILDIFSLPGNYVPMFIVSTKSIIQKIFITHY